MSGKMPAGNQGKLSSANENGREIREGRPSRYGVYLCRNEDLSPHHIISLQRYFRQSFEQAVQSLEAAQNGKVVPLGEYWHEVGEGKIWVVNANLLELSAPPLSLCMLRHN
jgi:hypothetical protein